MKGTPGAPAGGSTAPLVCKMHEEERELQYSLKAEYF